MITGITAFRPVTSKPAFKRREINNEETPFSFAGSKSDNYYESLKDKSKKLDACIEYKIDECLRTFDNAVNEIRENNRKGMINTSRLTEFRDEMKKAETFEEARDTYASCVEYYNNEFADFNNNGGPRKVISKNMDVARKCLDDFNQKVEEINEYKETLLDSIGENGEEISMLKFSPLYIDQKLNEKIAKAWSSWDFDEEIKKAFHREKNAYIVNMNNVFRDAKTLMDEMKSIYLDKKLEKEQIIKEGVLLRTHGHKDLIGLN